MYTFITILILITCVLLALTVLVQNSKGGGLAAGFSSSNQVLGVRKTTDFLEKLTWGLAIALFCLSLLASFSLPKKAGNISEESELQEQIDNTIVPGQGNFPAQQTPAQEAPPVEEQP